MPQLRSQGFCGLPAVPVFVPSEDSGTVVMLVVMVSSGAI